MTCTSGGPPGRLHPDATIVLPASPRSARLAREFVAQAMGREEDPIVALVVSELVTNAVVHGRHDPTVEVFLGPDEVTVEVLDDGPDLPVLRHPPPTIASGRGLDLVDQVADEWGVERRPHRPGKGVWARVHLSPPRQPPRPARRPPRRTASRADH